MRRFNKREKIIFVVCIMTILVYILRNNVYRSFQSKIDDLDRRIALKQKSIKKDLMTIQEAKSAESKYGLYLQKFKQTESNEQVMSMMLSAIESEAKKIGLPISEIKPQKVKEGDHSNHFSVSLTIDSDLVDIMKFLYILQGEPYLLEVEEFNISKNLNRNSQSDIKTHVVLTKMLIQ